MRWLRCVVKGLVIGVIIAGPAAIAAWIGSAAPSPQALGIVAITPSSGFLVSPRLYAPCQPPDCRAPCDYPPQLEVHVADFQLVVAVSLAPIDPVTVPRDGHEWTRLAEHLAHLRGEHVFDARGNITIVPVADVPYRDLVHAMEIADRAGFPRITYVPPHAAEFAPTDLR